MKIVGCDFHPGWQQVAIFEGDTGEIDHQAGQQSDEDAAGGSGAIGDSARSAVQSRVSSPLSRQGQGRGQGGGGQKVGRATLLDAVHRQAVSGDRTHREQPAGAPGRRKLDRDMAWTLSHLADSGSKYGKRN